MDEFGGRGHSHIEHVQRFEKEVVVFGVFQPFAIPSKAGEGIGETEPAQFANLLHYGFGHSVHVWDEGCFLAR